MEHVKIYFDPRCPWCFQTTKWARMLETKGLVDLDWGLYCLEVSNLKEGQDPIALGETGRSAPALRVAWAMKQKEDSLAMGRFYKALGYRTWDTNPPIKSLRQAVEESAVETGFDVSIVEEAMADPKTWLGVLEEHNTLITEKKGIGVPTLVLDGGDGPAIFGPVISLQPDEETGIEMWEHVRWLMRYPNFAELKRNRFGIPDLAGGKVPQSERPWGGRPWAEQVDPEGVDRHNADLTRGPDGSMQWVPRANRS